MWAKSHQKTNLSTAPKVWFVIAHNLVLFVLFVHLTQVIHLIFITICLTLVVVEWLRCIRPKPRNRFVIYAYDCAAVVAEEHTLFATCQLVLPESQINYKLFGIEKRKRRCRACDVCWYVPHAIVMCSNESMQRADFSFPRTEWKQ